MRYLQYVFFIFIIIFIDRITKFFALNYLKDNYVINRGISFGILNHSDSNIFFVITLAVIMVTMYWAYHSWSKFVSGYAIFGELAILAGSISNIIDRLFYGGVIDFINFNFKYFEFPSFNVADAAIVGGVFFVIFKTLNDE